MWMRFLAGVALCAATAACTNGGKAPNDREGGAALNQAGGPGVADSTGTSVVPPGPGSVDTAGQKPAAAGATTNARLDTTHH